MHCNENLLFKNDEEKKEEEKEENKEEEEPGLWEESFKNFHDSKPHGKNWILYIYIYLL